MKKSFWLLAMTFLLALVGCEQEEKLPDPQVSLRAGEATETTLSFTVTPKDAKTGAYMWVTAGAEIPAAADILSRGTAVDVSKETVQTISGLTENTEYTIVVAVQSGSVSKVSSPLKMRTLEKQIEQPTVTLTAGEVSQNGVSVKVNSTNAQEVACLIFEGEEVPTAEDIFEEGEEAEPNTEASIAFADLEPATTYKVIAAARNEGATVLSDVLEMTTAPEEEVTIAVINGRRWGETNYGFQMQLSDGRYLFLDMYCPTSVANIVPEAEYPVVSFPEYNDLLAALAEGQYFTHAEGSIIYAGEYSETAGQYEYQEQVAEGNISVQHLDAGYGLVFEIIGSEGTAYTLSHNGIVEALFEQEDFCNPPIPYNNDVIETSLTYVGGQHYADPGYAFTLWMTTEEGPYSIWTNLVFPAVTDGLLPEGTYTLFNGSMTDAIGEDNNPDGQWILGGEYSYTAEGEDGTYISFAEGSTITVEHLEGAYRLILDIKNTLGLNIKSTWEGQINKHWSWDPDIVQPGGGNSPVDEYKVVGTAGWGGTSYTILVRDKDNIDLVSLEAYCPSSVWNVLPEGEYIVDPNATWEGSQLSDYYIRSDWSASYLSGSNQSIASGKMIVKHLEEGYEIAIEGVDAAGFEFAYEWSGIVEPANDWADFNNPPIPYNDITVNTAVEDMKGSHTSQKYFDLYATTTGGEYQIYLPLVAPTDPGMGIIPEGTYVLGASETENQVYREAWLQEGDDEATRISLANATVKVSHLSQGYLVDIAVESGLKTKVNAIWSGLIFKTETSNNPFQNPGYTYPADIELVFDQMSFDGMSYDGYGGKYTFTNSRGDIMTLQLSVANVAEDGQMDEGIYTPQYYFMGGEEFIFNANETAFTMVDYPREWPYYADGGYVKVEKDGNNITIIYDGYTWTDSKKILRATYTGTFGAEETPVVDWSSVTATWNGASWKLDLIGYEEQSPVVFTFNMYHFNSDGTLASHTANDVLPAGTYNITDSDFSGLMIWASDSWAQTPGMRMSERPQGGTVTVNHVGGEYELIIDVTTSTGNYTATYKGAITGVPDPA